MKNLFRWDVIVLIIIIFGAILFVGNARVAMQFSPNKQGEFIPDENQPPIGGDKTLQLNPVKIKECTGKAALGFLLDRSSSMASDGKMDGLKAGFLNFARLLSDDSILGVQDFSSDTNPKGVVTVLIPYDYYKNIKPNITAVVQSLAPNGQTNMKTALLFSADRLREAKQKFPDYNFAFLFLSDGEPVPPDTQTPSAQDIYYLKSVGVRVFTIAYGTSTSGVRPLMRTIASSSADAYYAPNPSQIGQIFNEIASKICK